MDLWYWSKEEEKKDNPRFDDMDKKTMEFILFLFQNQLINRKISYREKKNIYNNLMGKRLYIFYYHSQFKSKQIISNDQCEFYSSIAKWVYLGE